MPDQLMAGCYPGATDRGEAHDRLDRILACNIRHFIDLMEPDELDFNARPFDPYVFQAANIAMKLGVEVSFDRFGIKDTWVPSRIEMGRILDRIDSNIVQSKPVYLHCWGGRGRTGTVVGCYLARHGLAQGQQILKHIAELRKNTADAHRASPETAQQVDMVLSWVEGE